ncbi:MAG: hypothetical protein ABIG44_13315 [Planctomycetota bacterium]
MSMKRRPCPYLNRDDGRCSHSLSMSTLPEAFCRCLARPEQCAVYRQLRHEKKVAEHVAACVQPV